MKKSSPGSQPQENPVRVLLERAKAGCQESAQRLFDQYHNSLKHIIRHALDDCMRKLYDSDDFLSSTWYDILMMDFEDEVLKSPARFMAYLERTAENKVRDARRAYLARSKRDLRREVWLEEIADKQMFCSRELSPSDNVVFTPRRSPVLLRQLRNPGHGRLAQEPIS